MCLLPCSYHSAHTASFCLLSTGTSWPHPLLYPPPLCHPLYGHTCVGTVTYLLSSSVIFNTMFPVDASTVSAMNRCVSMRMREACACACACACTRPVHVHAHGLRGHETSARPTLARVRSLLVLSRTQSLHPRTPDAERATRRWRIAPPPPPTLPLGGARFQLGQPS